MLFSVTVLSEVKQSSTSVQPKYSQNCILHKHNCNFKRLTIYEQNIIPLWGSLIEVINDLSTLLNSFPSIS